MRGFRRSHSNDQRVVWTGVALVSVGAVVAGSFGFIWPYYVVFVVAVYGFQLWYFRQSITQVRVTRAWLVPAILYALILIGTLTLWSVDAPGYAWVIYIAAAWLAWLGRSRYSSRLP